MGEIATRLSDHVIFTDDNPRTEDPKQIMDDIVKDLKSNNFEIIFDRAEAIKKGVSMLEENDILIVEGLHALNDELTKEVPDKSKYKIYISPLIYLNIDNDNRISLTDIRLLRRMVRDYYTRGHSPSSTLASWQDVRRGEEQYVFPYQDDANVIFNTFLVYELGVLKTYVEPLLYSVPPEDPEYHTAIRLLEILKLVLPIPNHDVPKLSILREFIGGGYFE